MVRFLIMPAKTATTGFLKTKVFWNKGYDVIIYVHEVTRKKLLRDSNYIVDLVMRPKVGSSSISMKEVVTPPAISAAFQQIGIKSFDLKSPF